MKKQICTMCNEQAYFYCGEAKKPKLFPTCRNHIDLLINLMSSSDQLIVKRIPRHLEVVK